MPRPLRYGTPTIRHTVFLHPETGAELERRAQASGLSEGQIIDALLANGEERGRVVSKPLWDRVDGMTLRMEPPPQMVVQHPELVIKDPLQHEAKRERPTVQPVLNNPERTTVSSGGHVWRKAGKYGSECVHCSKTSKTPSADTTPCPGAPS